jgi:hypothetical protein
VLLGPPPLFASIAIFVFLNIPSLGATYTATMLPSFRRFRHRQPQAPVVAGAVVP